RSRAAERARRAAIAAARRDAEGMPEQGTKNAAGLLINPDSDRFSAVLFGRCRSWPPNRAVPRD
ncbi:hypothetical protein HMPREF0731_2422, partial [Pseudoroseomonas cervicalis ATCC 49957]